MAAVKDARLANSSQHFSMLLAERAGSYKPMVQLFAAKLEPVVSSGLIDQRAASQVHWPEGALQGGSPG
jgi:hypothetical protein